MQFWSYNQHIISKFSSKMSCYSPKNLFGEGTVGGQTSDWGKLCPPALPSTLRTVLALSRLVFKMLMTYAFLTSRTSRPLLQCGNADRWVRLPTCGFLLVFYTNHCYKAGGMRVKQLSVILSSLRW